LERASFLPPEVLFNYQDARPQTDQYAAAAVIYYLLTGAPGLQMPRQKERRYSSLLRNQVMPIQERRADVPAALADALHRALSRSPDQRFADVAEFRQALLRSAS